MNIQYISDNIGLTTAVVIPIDEWNQITEKYPDLEKTEIELPQWQKDLFKERKQLLTQHPEMGISLDDFLTHTQAEADEEIKSYCFRSS